MIFEGGVGGGGWARRGFWSLRIRRFAEYGVSFDTPCLNPQRGAADLRRKRQPAAHAVPCISETAEKIVKYTVFVEVTPWMEPKGAKSEPTGAKREPKGVKREPKGAKSEPKGAKKEPKGAKMETKSINNPSKWFPKPTRAPRSILDGQNGTKRHPKSMQNHFKNRCKNQCRKGIGK